MSDDGRRERMLAAYFDGTLAADEVPVLEEAFRQDGELRRRFWREAMFFQHLTGELQGKELARRPRLAPPRRFGWIAIAAAVLLTAGGWWWWASYSDEPVEDGYWTATVEDLIVRCPDGSTLALAAGSVLHQEQSATGLAYWLEHGAVRAQVVPRTGHAPFVIRTDHLFTSVVGTAYTLATDAQASLLTVHEGVVAWRSLYDGAAGRAGPGEEALVLTSTALTELQAAAPGLHGVDDAVPWQRLDLDLPDAWGWRRPSRDPNDRAELLIDLPKDLDSACLLLVYRTDRWPTISMRIEGLQEVVNLPIRPQDVLDVRIPAQGLATLLGPGLDAATIQAYAVAFQQMPPDHLQNWCELQYVRPKSGPLRYLARGVPRAINLIGDEPTELLPDAILWRPLVPLP